MRNPNPAKARAIACATLICAVALALPQAAAASALPQGAAASVLPQGASARADRVTLVWLTDAPTPSRLAAAGLAPGLMSAGLGSVPAQQTYLDVGQGNRVFDSLYDEALPALGSDCRRWRRQVRRRAETAPADVVPGLLATALASAGAGLRAIGASSCALWARRGDGPGALEVREGTVADLAPLIDGQRGGDLLIAIERPPPRDGLPLAIGIAGRGFAGVLSSPSTRLDGYVLSTDVAPTVLRRLGAAVPGEMSGRPIAARGPADAGAVEALGARMEVISERRGPVIGVTLLAWLLALCLVAAIGRGRGARGAVKVVAVAAVLLPAALLAAAALEWGAGAERLLAMLGPPAVAALAVAALRGYRAIGAAAAVTVLAYAVDVVAGSPLTALSLLGPNPGLGVRFYGIGNELEAVLAVLVVAGTGAGLAGFAPRLRPGAAAAAFLAVGMAAAFVFAAGRFGADVGAAIVMPVGAAVAAAAVAARRRRTALIALAAPLLALALLALVDLVSGAEAHLTRSVLDAGGLGDLADVAQRRLQLSARSFARPVLLAFLPVVAALGAVAWLRRDRLGAWLARWPTVRAGLLGALAATVVGTLANDSGALLLEIGTAYLLVFVGYAWAESAAER